MSKQKFVATDRPTRLSSKRSTSEPQPSTTPTTVTGRRRTMVKKAPKKSVFLPFFGIFLQLVIIGIGISVITGTSIAFFRPEPVVVAPPETTPTDTPKTTPTTSPLPEPATKTELTELTTKINALTKSQPDITVETYLTDLDSGGYVNIKGSEAIASASMIKIPVLVAFLQDVDAGKARLDEQLVLSKDVIVGESGGLQYEPVGTKISALETITLMIIISDNTATNMIIKRIGGIEEANQRFLSWDLTSTVIRNPLPDLTGTNTTSPEDLVNLLSMVEQGKILSPRSRDRLMDIMHRTKTNTLLPQGIPPDARIAHKTGDIKSVVGDAGIIDMPNGKRYIISAIAKRPSNDQRANELIRQISRTVYTHLQDMPKPKPVAN
ncbi:serine hydrolase [Synechococcus sp. PCC 7502]|uniref:serine hydrolase n=1 Tax=Synechococcus sp. PCC 7502 TaxID=1173263 RepID=UPI001FEE2115|nr:serine hydrolase [Synechococcus sp. PCC 7502]